MNWAGKFFGASIGSIFGPAGILAGSFAGHFLKDKKKQAPVPDPIPMTSQDRNNLLFKGTFTLLSRTAHANHSISDKEAELLQYIMREELSMKTASRSRAIKIFNSTSWAESTALINELSLGFRHDPRQLQQIFSMLLAMALADGSIAHKADILLIECLEIFQIDATHYAKIRETHLAPNGQDYDILECPPNTSKDELKQIWRQHCFELHPDRLISLNEEQQKAAGIKLDQIHQAYNRLKKLK